MRILYYINSLFAKIIKPAIIIVLILLTLKVGSELIWPEFWS